jgi:hypothetical protein
MIKIVFIIFLCATYSLFSQKNEGFTHPKLNIEYSDYKKDSFKKLNSGLLTYFVLGFDSVADFKILINNKEISRCDKCATNYSVGFVLEQNKSLYQCYFNATQFKKGNMFSMIYGKEKISFKIDSTIIRYSYLSIHRTTSNKWNLNYSYFKPYNNENLK